MTEKDKNEAEEEIIVSDHDDETANATLRKVKKALKECEKEKKEYLDGWKRAKADAINDRKRQQKLLETEQRNALARYASAMLPVLDSVRNAMNESSGAALQSGIERIHTQCVQSLTSIGVEIIDPLGEPFDPHRHEAAGERSVSSEKQKDTVVEVVRVGAVGGNTIIRPAMVYVGSYNPEEDLEK